MGRSLDVCLGLEKQACNRCPRLGIAGMQASLQLRAPQAVLGRLVIQTLRQVVG